MFSKENIFKQNFNKGHRRKKKEKNQEDGNEINKELEKDREKMVGRKIEKDPMYIKSTWRNKNKTMNKS